MQQAPLPFTELLQTPLNQIIQGLGDAKKVKTVKTNGYNPKNYPTVC